MKEKKISIKGLAVNYKIQGRGKPVLILHGWGVGNSNSWTKVQKFLSLAKYKVIVPDFPGFGKSEVPKKIWNVSDYADWLNSFVNKLKLKKFNLIAHSFGARVATKFIVKHPKKVDRLVLVAPAGIKQKPNIETRLIFLISKIGKFFLNIKKTEKTKEKLKKAFYFFLRNKDYIRAEGVMKEIIKEVISEDLTPLFSKITNKTLIVWGAKDKILPKSQAKVFKEKIKNSRVEIIPEAGHSPHLISSDKLLGIIIKFFKE